MKRLVTVLGTLILSALVAQFAWAGNGILLVDDDCSCDVTSPSGPFTDVRDVFEDALQYAGFSPHAGAQFRGEYEIYEVGLLNDDGPDFTKMADYEMVIWFTGETCCTYPSFCLTPTDQTELGLYLDNGGKLFLSAQDFLNTYGEHHTFHSGEFPYDYLMLDSCVVSVWQDTDHVAEGRGATENAVTAGMTFQLQNPFGSGKDATLDMDWIQPISAAKTTVMGEFSIDDAAGSGFAALSWKEAGKGYLGPRVFFTTISFAGLKDGTSPNTKGEMMLHMMSDWMIGDYADYGDAPDPPYISMYETVDDSFGIANAGARHENQEGIFEWLGDDGVIASDIDMEFNSIQTGDNFDDGVSFNFPYTPGGMGSVDITIQVSDWTSGRYALADLYLHGFFDWHNDGDWNDPGDNVFCGVVHNPHPIHENWGGNSQTFTISFPVPADAVEDQGFWTRFRLDWDDNRNWDRFTASAGEVEDYEITLDGPVSVGLSTFYASAGDRQATLYWTTESEVNNAGFYLMRSEDGTGYTRVNEELIHGQGTSETRHEYSYVDKGLVNGLIYSYKLVDVDLNGVRSVHGPITVTPQAAVQVPTSYALSQNYPNPFNAQTAITYAIPKDSHVSLKVFNILGEEVRTLVDGHQSANTYQVTWDGKDAAGKLTASGVYFCTLKAGEFSETMKMVFLR